MEPCDDSLQGGEGASALTCAAVLSLPLVQLRENGNKIAPSSDNVTVTMTYTNHQPAWSCGFSLDGRHIAVAYGAPDPCIRIFRNDDNHTQAGSNALSYPSSWSLVDTLVGMQMRTIRCVAFAPIHRPLVLAAASFDGTIAIWEQQQSTTFAMNASTTDTNTNTNTPTLTSTTAPTMNTTHLNHSWECTAQLEGHENEVKCVKWNSTGSLLATCGRDKVRFTIMCVRACANGKLALDTLTVFTVSCSLDCLDMGMFFARSRGRYEPELDDCII
jgi:WD40 repeat protein